MGVFGLWKLLEGTGHPVTLESLEGKIVAVDISIWLNMAVKGMRDLHGHSSSDAHLLTLFHRICKLLYFGIKPVFVFDGQAPLIKLKTLQERRQRKAMHIQERQTASEKMLQNFLKHQVLDQAIKAQKKNGKDSDQKKASSRSNATAPVDNKPRKTYRPAEENLFQLPPVKNGLDLNSSDEEREQEWMGRSNTRDSLFGAAMSGDFKQMMSIDVESDDFRNLPPDIQHELLTDIKEIRKRRRTQLELMPEKCDSFSSYQLSGLLAKRNLSDKIKTVEKQMEQQSMASMTEAALRDDWHEASRIDASKISSEDATHYILIRGLKQKQQKSDQDAAKIPKERKIAVERDTSVAKDDMLLADQNDHDLPVCGKQEISKSDLPVSENLSQLIDNNKVAEFTELSSDENCELKKPDNEPTDSIKLSTVGAFASEASSSFTSAQTSSAVLDERDVTKVPESAERNNSAQFRTSQEFDANGNFPPETEESAASGSSSSVPSSAVVELAATSADTSSQLDVRLEDGRAVAMQVTSNKTLDKESSDEDFVEVPISVEDPSVDSDASNDKPSGTSSEVHVDPYVNPWNDVRGNDLLQINDELDKEDIALLERMQSASRAARDVSDFATTECQELLQLFGIPFVVSPQEAEAQCAFLDKAGLTQGTITEDSDVWLFGGSVVYKDVFDRKRDPCCYMLKDIKAELGLEQEHFINIALCSGSDYTPGIEGVGPVRGLEIMKEFPGPGIEGLKAFKQWWQEAHRQVKLPASETKIKGQLRKLDVPSAFPSQHVADAYLNPRVNDSLQEFTWGIPDLSGIREFAEQRLQWTRKKVDDDLLPILKRAAARNEKRQLLMTSFIQRTPAFAPSRSKTKSKRVRRAVASLLEAPNVPAETSSTTKSARVRNGGKGRKRRGKSVPVKDVKKTAVAVDASALGLSESSDSS